MKKYFIYAMSIAAAGLFVACDGKNTDEEIKISIMPTAITGFSGAGGTQTMEIEAPADWKVSIPAGITWVSVTPNEGKAEEKVTVTFDIKSNPTNEVRTTTAIVTAGTTTLPVTISQNSGTTQPSDNVRLYGPVFSNLLYMDLYFTPFEGVENHALVLVDSEGEFIDIATPEFREPDEDSDDEFYTFLIYEIEKWGTYTFEYWGFDSNGEETGNFLTEIKNVKKSNDHSVRFVMLDEKPTLTAVDSENGDGSKNLIITNSLKGIRTYMVYSSIYDQPMMTTVNIDEETGEEECMQNLVESGEYWVKAVLSYDYAGESPVYGPASDKLTVTITKPAE